MDSFSNDFFAHIPSTEEKDEVRKQKIPLNGMQQFATISWPLCRHTS